MIEAVNSVLQTASFVRASSEQVSTADSFAANPDRVQKVAQAPFVSPYIVVDVNLNKAVIQLRNGETGDVEGQFPSQTALEARARQDRQAAAQGETAAPLQQQQEAKSSSSAATAAPSQPETPPPPSTTDRSAITTQQQAAFQAAAQAGNSNAGNVTLLA